MALDYTVDNRQTEARAFADFFGSEERVKYATADFRGDAASGIGDRDL
jgi:hypothetical protein